MSPFLFTLRYHTGCIEAVPSRWFCQRNAHANLCFHYVHCRGSSIRNSLNRGKGIGSVGTIHAPLQAQHDIQGRRYRFVQTISCAPTVAHCTLGTKVKKIIELSLRPCKLSAARWGKGIGSVGTIHAPLQAQHDIQGAGVALFRR